MQEVLKLLKRNHIKMPSRSSSSSLPSDIQQGAYVHKFQGETNLSPRYLSGAKHDTMTPIRIRPASDFESVEGGVQGQTHSNGEQSEGTVDIAALEREMRLEQKRALKRLGGGADGGDEYAMSISGSTDVRQSHRLMLRSAYDGYAWDGEPPLTTSTLEHAACVDYILFSAEKLEAMTVLSLPELHDLTNDDTRDLEMCRDDSAAMMPPAGWNASFNAHEAEDNPLAYSGTWVGAIKQNENKTHRYLPNTEYASSHLALLVEFRYRKEGLEADWSEAPNN